MDRAQVRSRKGHRAAVLVAAAAFGTAGLRLAQAQDLPTAPGPGASESAEPAPAPANPALESAKELFRQGNELRKAGDVAGALLRYQRSRALVPSVPNTLNAAICLDRLGRYDEALELYDELIAVFRDQLGDEERQSIGAAATRLRRKVGNIDVASNVDGTLVIDGRMRGRLPIEAAVRVMPGEHVVRVVKDGWESFEARVSVREGDTEQIDARLKPLQSAGRLRVDEPGMAGAELYVDGALVGLLPWEGTLAPGPHVVWIRKGDQGSAPSLAQVLRSQTTTVRVATGQLGPQLRISAEPAGADLFVNGVPMGPGRWVGRLRTGRHLVEAREDGYRTSALTVVVGDRPLPDVRLRLRVDESHPRWRRPPTGRIWVEGAGALAWGRSFASGAEAWCDQNGCDSRDRPSGWMAGLRGGYEFPIGLSVELGAAYWQMEARLQRRIPIEAQPAPAYFVFRDRLRMAGPVGFLGVGWRAGIGSRFDLAGRVSAGIASFAVQDVIEGEAQAPGQSVMLDIEQAGRSERSSAIVLLPAGGAGVWFGDLRFGLDLAGAWVMSTGPQFETGTAFVASGACQPGQPQGVGCARGTDAIARERAHGRFFALTPGANARVRF